MLELKIPINTIVNLILERMKLELAFIKRAKQYHPEITLQNLPANELMLLAKCAIIDLAFFLPAGIHYENNNLAYIIYYAMNKLGDILMCTNFKEFTLKDAEKLIDPIRKLFNSSLKDNSFLNN